MNERSLPLPPELARLSTFIDSKTECIAGSSNELRSIALSAAKHVFDWALETETSSKPHLGTLLGTLTQAAPPQTRSGGSKSRKERSPSPGQKSPKNFNVGETQLPSLFIEGMNIDQIWQQLDLRASRICENLQILQGEDENECAYSDSENDDDEEDEGDEEGEGEEDENDAAAMDVDGDDNLWEGLSSEEEGSSSTAEGVVSLGEEESGDDDDHGSPTSMLDVIHQKPSSYSHGYSGLDDDFFNLANFNAETSELEAKDVSKRKSDIAEEESSEESEVDLFGSVSETEEAPVELFYNDFFERPGRVYDKNIKSSRVRFHRRVSVKKIKAVGRGMPVSSMGEEDSEDED